MKVEFFIMLKKKKNLNYIILCYIFFLNYLFENSYKENILTI